MKLTMLWASMITQPLPNCCRILHRPSIAKNCALLMLRFDVCLDYFVGLRALDAEEVTVRQATHEGGGRRTAMGGCSSNVTITSGN